MLWSKACLIISPIIENKFLIILGIFESTFLIKYIIWGYPLTEKLKPMSMSPIMLY